MADAGRQGPRPYQSLYRRFRPQRFEEVLGQEHVSLALRNAVRDGRVGPRVPVQRATRAQGRPRRPGSWPRRLNCAALEDGEPCGRCDSCIEIARGSSLDVHELDAASNNGVDAMRDLVSHAALGTPGRWKVYIVDEVHMLSTAASNALLKTLEEPPGHVVFVLATTDPQKVLPTIRSRTQHFEFRLLGPEMLVGAAPPGAQRQGLALPDEAIDAAVRRGRGSARDALSALDQVAAGGVVDDDIEVLAELAEALAEHDSSRALVAVAHASEAGRDPQRLAADLAEYLRQGFLAIVAGELVSVSGSDRTRVEDVGATHGAPGSGAQPRGARPGPGRHARHPRPARAPRGRAHQAHPPAGRRFHQRPARAAGAAGTGRGRRRGNGPCRTHRDQRAAFGRSPARTPRFPTADPRRWRRSLCSGRRTVVCARDLPRPRHFPVAPAGGAESGPDLARRTLGAVRRQGGSTSRPERTERRRFSECSELSG